MCSRLLAYRYTGRTATRCAALIMCRLSDSFALQTVSSRYLGLVHSKTACPKRPPHSQPTNQTPMEPEGSIAPRSLGAIGGGGSLRGCHIRIGHVSRKVQFERWAVGGGQRTMGQWRNGSFLSGAVRCLTSDEDFGSRHPRHSRKAGEATIEADTFAEEKHERRPTSRFLPLSASTSPLRFPCRYFSSSWPLQGVSVSRCQARPNTQHVTGQAPCFGGPFKRL